MKRNVSSYRKSVQPPSSVLSIDKLSIIISAKNEGQYIRSTVESLLNTAYYGDFEVIVINDGSTDGSCDFLMQPEYSTVIYEKGCDLGVAGSRRLGASMATGDVMLFLDAHLRFSSGWLTTLLRPLQDSNTHAVCSGIKNISENNRIIYSFYGGTWNEWLVWQPILKKPSRVREVPLSPGGCTAIRATAYKAVGGHGEMFRGWGYEDQELSLRLWTTGHRIVIQPNVQVIHIERKKQYEIDSKARKRNLAYLAFLHMDQNHLEKVRLMWRLDQQYLEIFSELSKDEECIRLKKEFEHIRKKSFAWFLKKFAISF